MHDHHDSGVLAVNLEGQYTRKQSARSARSKHTAPQCGITSLRNSSDRISRTVPNSGAGIEVAPFPATVDPFSSTVIVRSAVSTVSTPVQNTLRKTTATTLQALRPELAHKCIIFVIVESIAVLRCSLGRYQLFCHLRYRK
jgi:hypothetical protein